MTHSDKMTSAYRKYFENITGGNALLKAAWLGRLRLARLLIEGGMDVNTRNADGQTCLMVACLTNYEDAHSSEPLTMIQYFLRHVNDINATDSHGRTALMYACSRSLGYAVCRLMLDHGADPIQCDNTGMNSISYAGETEQLDVMELLRNAAKARGHDVVVVVVHTKKGMLDDMKRQTSVDKDIEVGPIYEFPVTRRHPERALGSLSPGRRRKSQSTPTTPAPPAPLTPSVSSELLASASAEIGKSQEQLQQEMQALDISCTPNSNDRQLKQPDILLVTNENDSRADRPENKMRKSKSAIYEQTTTVD